MDDALRTWVAEVEDSSSSAALRVLIGGVTALHPAPTAECGPFNVRFHLEDRVLCDISSFGSLFIVRVGPQQTVEYRVRDVAGALEALDHVVRYHVRTAWGPAASVG